jgi:hypothetical protein
VNDFDHRVRIGGQVPSVECSANQQGEVIAVDLDHLRNAIQCHAATWAGKDWSKSAKGNGACLSDLFTLLLTE